MKEDGLSEEHEITMIRVHAVQAAPSIVPDPFTWNNFRERTQLAIEVGRSVLVDKFMSSG